LIDFERDKVYAACKLPEQETDRQTERERERERFSYRYCSLLLQAFNVGNKPRDGTFGACFHPSQPSAIAAAVSTPLEDLIFAARPAKRLWLAKVKHVAMLRW
jgi:hypothetical protein